MENSKKILLPKVYNEEIWNISRVPEHRKYLGKMYVSWSQIESFNDKSGFNTGFLGMYEYILKYFSGAKFPDMGWGDFGSETEAYITYRGRDAEVPEGDEGTKESLKNSYINFKDEEKRVLEKIEPLGVFQKEICYYIEELDIIVLGYIDDMTPPQGNVVKLLRDYKTKSESSKKDLHLPKKLQIPLYVLGLRQEGLEVERAEYCIIERGGGYQCMQGGGRDVLFVKDRIWYEDFKYDEKKLKETKKSIISTVKHISDLYKTYVKFFKIED